MCRTEFLEKRYDDLRRVLLGSSPDARLSSREFDGLCSILSQIVGINAKKPHETITKITQHIMEQVLLDLKRKEFNKKQIKTYEEELSRIALFKALFQEELDSMKEKTPAELSQIFRNKFPLELVQDDKAM